MLIDNPAGNYAFLAADDPYSAGVVAQPGYEIVRVVLKEAIPYRKGFDLISEYLEKQSRPRSALCNVELRSPYPATFDGFASFNDAYRSLLDSWDLLVGDMNPIARTNVVPALHSPSEPALYAFGYSTPSAKSNGERTFVVSGAGELLDSDLNSKKITRAKDTSEDAIREKANCVLEILQSRLKQMGVKASSVTAVNVYTVHNIFPHLEPTILMALPQASFHGLRWHFARPPVLDIEFEMDVRGIQAEHLCPVDGFGS
jgi:hypothetical protein